jgi:hypothetical protein
MLTNPTPIDSALQQFNADDYTVKICQAIFRTLPFAPPQPEYQTLSEAVRVLYPAATPQIVQRTTQIATSEQMVSALKIADYIDTGDTGIAVFSGIKSAFNLFFSDNRAEALETDSQQALDAALKLLGIGYIIHQSYPGSIAEKMQLFYTAPAGQALVYYYAAIEVCLPFGDNLVSGGGNFLQGLWQKYGNQAAGKLGGLMGGGALSQATSMVGSLLQPVNQIVLKVAPFSKTIAQAAKQYVPSTLNVVDKAAGIVATGADVLPAYRYLCARLTAESSVLLASRGL